MTRSELVIRLAETHASLMHKDVELTVDIILDAISRELTKGGRIEIRGFGSFVLNYRPPRKGRNPKNGESVMIPAKYVPHFRTGKELRERVDP